MTRSARSVRRHARGRDGHLDDRHVRVDRHDTTLLCHDSPAAVEWRRLGAPPAARHAHPHRPGAAGSTPARAATATARPTGDALRCRLRGRFPHVRLFWCDRAGASCCLCTACMHCTAHRMRAACHPQALPAALMRSGSSANAATTLGTLGSVSALVEVMLSNSFGKITDAIGRKPVLILAPALAVAARATVVVWPSLPVLLGARFCTTLVVPLLRLACACAPHVHRMCTACAPHVHCMCTACASRVHCMCTACALHVHRMCIACAPHVHCVRTACAGAAVLARLLVVPRRPVWSQLHLPRHRQLTRRGVHGSGLRCGHAARWEAE